MIILIILLIKFSYQEFIRLFNDEVYTCGFRKKALDLLIRQEGDGSGGSNWGGGAAFYGGETGSFAGTVLAPNSGGPDQSFFFKEISPDKYIIIDYKSQCIEFNTYKSTFECKKCTGSVFQNFVILYDMDGEACCSYVANKYVIKPFGRYRKIYDSMRHHRAGINNSILNIIIKNKLYFHKNDLFLLNFNIV